MRRDPIIGEDWKVGATQYFSFKYYSLIDYILSLCISLVGIMMAIISDSFIYLFIWTFTIFILFLVEIVLDQSDRSIGNRMLIFSSILFLSYVSIQKSIPYLTVILAILLGLKFLNAPLQNFLLQFYEDILIPNNESVSLVLNEHMARLEETSYRVETNEEFQSRIFLISKKIVGIFGVSFAVTIILYYFVLPNNTVGDYVRLAILAITSLTFTYTVVAWYIDKRRSRRQQLEVQDIGDEALFPEMME